MTQKTISHIYESRESYTSVYPWFWGLEKKGLNPRFITMDGEKSVIRAIQQIWPETKIQRCLYHIQREGMRWLRTYPKTLAGRELRELLKTLGRIETWKERNTFITSYVSWLNKHEAFVRALPHSEVAYKDLKKAMRLIWNGLPDMFHYLKDRNVPKMTNMLEGFYSRLKSDYRRHRGLTEKHKIGYLKWYCYFKNQEK